MAKKKNKKNISQKISPEKYIVTKARSLPLAECLINSNWEEAGLADIIVARQHKSGNYTLGVYLVDLLCIGVKETFFKYNISQKEYEHILRKMPLVPISYNEVHNIIFGAIAYAEDLGIDPHHVFDITQYIIEEDSDDIPLIEYEFGRNGKPCLNVSSNRIASKYLQKLNESVGEGNYEFIIEVGGDKYDDYEDEDDYDYEDEDEDEDEDYKPIFTEEMMRNWNIMQEKIKKSKALPHAKYSYNYPEYPKALKLNHKELEIFFLPEYNDFVDADTIDKILALPHETLVKDLENIALYEIGRTFGDKTEELNGKEFIGTLTHVLFFLGELRSEQSLGVLLEIMRQNELFREYHFGDATPDIINLTIYYTGRNNLTALLDYMKEPGLNPHLKIHVCDAVSIVLTAEPERREEVIEWFREILDFFFVNISDTSLYDALLIGLITINILDIRAVELLPELKRLYETGLVNELICGDYEAVVKRMDLNTEILKDHTLFNIYDRYEDFNKRWGKTED